MDNFEVGERVVHDWGAGRLTYGTILAFYREDGVYFLPENTDIFGAKDHLYQGQACYLLSLKYLKKCGPPLSSQEAVLARIKSLNLRFKTKTLPKTTMKPLALPR